MSTVAKTVWLIESRFREALSLDDLARMRASRGRI